MQFVKKYQIHWVTIWQIFNIQRLVCILCSIVFFFFAFCLFVCFIVFLSYFYFFLILLFNQVSSIHSNEQLIIGKCIAFITGKFWMIILLCFLFVINLDKVYKFQNNLNCMVLLYT